MGMDALHLRRDRLPCPPRRLLEEEAAGKAACVAGQLWGGSAGLSSRHSSAVRAPRSRASNGKRLLSVTGTEGWSRRVHHCPLSAPCPPLPWAQVAGVHSQALPDLPNGTFDLEQLELTIREAHGSRYHPRPELICLENTHSSAGGRALPLTYLRQVRGLADRYGLRVHMDGARLMNAAVAQGVEPAQIAQHCDSVSLCFSKVCLCGEGPAGLAGASTRQSLPLFAGVGPAGVRAAAAHLGLQRAEITLRRDHEHARRFAEGIQALDSPLCSVSLAAVETNIVMVDVQGAWPSPAELCDRLRAVSEEEEAETGQAVSVLLLPWSARSLRAVWHRDVSARDTELARRKLEFVARKCQEELASGLHPAPPGTGGA
ncbi:probable low-specificity L-threonine aldolase 2 [Geospiza fortis]|uniref:Probable low-specificity L-threonine aldolase 2 n=1 Tax=Geospiza fortis TaxID=48883 RepID=A0A8N5F331_GEOFO|nr:probable low-specificity L-threonine aldolase 2 [Geospiza fortis]